MRQAVAARAQEVGRHHRFFSCRGPACPSRSSGRPQSPPKPTTTLPGSRLPPSFLIPSRSSISAAAIRPASWTRFGSRRCSRRAIPRRSSVSLPIWRWICAAICEGRGMSPARQTRRKSCVWPRPGPVAGHAAGRGELLEAIETCVGAGRFAGQRPGRRRRRPGRSGRPAARALANGTPRSGLAVQIEAAMTRLKLPGPDAIDAEPRELRLDPLRSRLDRGRAVLVPAFQSARHPYAERGSIPKASGIGRI